MEGSLVGIAAKVALFYIPFLFALCFHEFAHGWMALKKGDNTAQLMGRMTLSPFPHMDIWGTVVLPIFAVVSGWGFLFGWAKPVPVNPRNLQRPKEDMFWIALAGPLSNIILSVVGEIALVLSAIFLKDTSIGAPHH